MDDIIGMIATTNNHIESTHAPERRAAHTCVVAVCRAAGGTMRCKYGNSQ